MYDNDLLNDTLEHGLLTGLVVADELRRHVLELLDVNLPADQFLRQAREMVAAYEPLFARALSDTMLVAWLLGGTEAAGDFPEGVLERTVEIPPLPPVYGPEESVADFDALTVAARELQSWKVLTPTEFAAASADARASAFTVARLATREAVEAVKQAAWENLLAGGGWQEMRDKVAEALEGKEAPLSDRHVETLWRTVSSKALAIGQERVLRHPLVEDEFPFRATEPIRDGRLTELCLVVSRSGLDGTNVFYYNDPVWFRYLPPRHFR